MHQSIQSPVLFIFHTVAFFPFATTFHTSTAFSACTTTASSKRLEKMPGPKKNSKLQFQHIKNRNIHFKVSLYWMWTVITILIFVLHPFHDLANNLNYNSDKPLITPFLNNSLKSSKFLFVSMFLPTFIKNMNNFNSKIIKDWNSFKNRGTIKSFFFTFNKFIW